jgi:hypothetical protein
VYIRQVANQKKEFAVNALGKIEALGVPVCYFDNSKNAILHSIKIGLIDQSAMNVV